ncbi:hypothetical protein HYO65_gp212 [Tenacibaculum phage PTm1]|uniref:Uncharacterized protein n=2 Tax=Shirahamavirus PTm1 TaxID=2846435 RepID=A0A5S9HXN5_9CAUD|nr:hypothetical protein HYO65_gp212 [Tenacibaculum phage PTm1]BBI90604.1 hypothetical protein [Tenacibaculum phage PTm1]BBI90911.1 hypothetical protein [Tenacibaculum phage PTm5]
MTTKELKTKVIGHIDSITEKNEIPELYPFTKVIEFLKSLEGIKGLPLEKGLDGILFNYKNAFESLKALDGDEHNYLAHKTKFKTTIHSLRYFCSWCLKLVKSRPDITDAELVDEFKWYVDFRANKLITEILENNPRMNSTNPISNLKDVYGNDTRIRLYKELFLPLQLAKNGESFDSFLAMQRKFLTN